jgi:hypothetical protein
MRNPFPGPRASREGAYGAHPGAQPFKPFRERLEA